MTAARLNLFSLPAQTPFLPALAEGLVDRYYDPADPSSLGRVTILLPTRRASRAIAEHLIVQIHARGLVPALIMPQIRPLGDVDEDGLILAGDEFSADADMPEALAPLRRRFLLMAMISQWGTARGHPLAVVQCFRLAGELERLIDRADTQGVGLEGLEALVPVDLAGHWQEVLSFLNIVARHWTLIESAEGAIGPARRRALLMRRLRQRWTDHPPQGPIIAAGSTGTIPETAALLQVIAQLPQGCVIFPGLDRDADETVWAAVDASHPQGAMKALLERLGAARDDVQIWPYGNAVSPTRMRLLNEALRPWVVTDDWHRLSGLPRPDGSLDIKLIEAAHEEEEAKIAALILRNSLESPARRAALITPNRRLARAVQAELRRWAIAVDDSAGVPLAQTTRGVFLRLIARAAAERLAPVALLALLKHHLSGLDPARQRVGALDRLVLRGLRPAGGFDGLKAAIRDRAPDKAKPALFALCAQLEHAIGPFVALFEKSEPVSFAHLFEAHLRAAEALNADCEDGLWSGEEGEALADLLQQFAAESELLNRHDPAEYPDFWDALLAGPVVRPSFSRHPRIFIWGPLEARLQSADIVILGGLNEGSWPAEPAGDPWMSRSMIAALGLPPPEQRLGLSAHDFVQSASAAGQVYLLRSRKADGAPTVASRWIVRLQTLMGGLGLSGDLAADPGWLGMARALDLPKTPRQAVLPPKPTPPVEARPRRLSVSAIERWVRDPYSIYAEHILHLRSLRGLDQKPDAAMRGQILHAIVEVFSDPKFDPAAPGALDILRARGSEQFMARSIPADVQALWWPRFEASAMWLLADEIQRRAAGECLLGAEIKGEVTIDQCARTFVIHARADRIDTDPSGALIISDYKTGKPPGANELGVGLAPQLPLEAMIAQKGGFSSITGRRVSALRVLRMSGTARAGERSEFANVEELIRINERELRALIERYDQAAYPYRSRPVPKFARDQGDFDHLARVKEWTAADASEDEA